MKFRKDKQDTYEKVGKYTDIVDERERKEIANIISMLDDDERVLEVATQSRFVPGGSVLTTPNTIFATDKKIIIRNPTMLGLRKSVEYYPYRHIISAKIEEGRFSSTLVFTAPGMGTAARPGRKQGVGAWGREEDGMIDAIPTEKAHKILKIVLERTNREK